LNLEEKNILVNLGSGVGYSNLEVVQTIEKITGEKVNYKIGPRREGDPDFLVANINLAKKLLNYEPKHDIESIIKTAYAWQKKRTSR
jgi:UDP-glucose 4-epimerase